MECHTATQVTTHERSFPFSDNLATLMFIVASDLSAAQRETHKFLALKEMNVTVYTVDAVKTVFVKSSMENPSPSERTRRQNEQNLHRRKLC